MLEIFGWHEETLDDFPIWLFQTTLHRCFLVSEQKQPKTAIYNHGIQYTYIYIYIISYMYIYIYIISYMYIYIISYIATRSHRSGNAAQGILAWTVPAPSLTSLTLAQRLVPSRWVRTSSASPSDVCAPMLPSRSWLVVGGAAEMFENWLVPVFGSWLVSTKRFLVHGLWMVIVPMDYGWL